MQGATTSFLGDGNRVGWCPPGTVSRQKWKRTEEEKGLRNKGDLKNEHDPNNEDNIENKDYL